MDMDDGQVHNRIEELVQEQRRLRDSPPDEGDAHGREGRLASIQIELDQCWDLVRQREAKLNAGENPEEAQLRPASEVEGYKQ